MKKSKKLYRPRNIYTHNGTTGYYVDLGSDYRFTRHSKSSLKEIQEEITHGKMKRGGGMSGPRVDWTPLYKFLVKSVGKSWEDIWKEALKKSSGNYEAIQVLVQNVNKSGLPCEMPESPRSIIRYGEGAYFTGLYVTDEGILEPVNKDTFSEFIENLRTGNWWYTGYTTRWTDTLDGKKYKKK